MNTDLTRLIPTNATHAMVEERLHRGAMVFAVIAIVPDGAAIPINGYSSESLANTVRDEINAHLASPLTSL